MALFPLQEGGSMTIINSGVFSAGGGGSSSTVLQTFNWTGGFSVFDFEIIEYGDGYYAGKNSSVNQLPTLFTVFRGPRYNYSTGSVTIPLKSNTQYTFRVRNTYGEAEVYVETCYVDGNNQYFTTGDTDGTSTLEIHYTWAPV